MRARQQTAAVHGAGEARRGHGGVTPTWWSPLAPQDVGHALEQLGARAVAPKQISAWALDTSSDNFTPALVFAPEPYQGGTLVHVRILPQGFAKDFGMAVQLGLTVFAALFAVGALLTMQGAMLQQVLLALGLAWSLMMASFAGGSVLVGALTRSERRSTCDRVRSALFARGA